MKVLVGFLFLTLIGCQSNRYQRDLAGNKMKTPIIIKENQIESGRFYLGCRYDGFNDECHLDTGSSYTSLSWNEKTKNYAVSGQQTRSSASGIESTEDNIILQNFSIGSAKTEDFKVVRYSEEKNQDSRLGMSFLKNFNFTFDFDNEVLIFSKENINLPMFSDSKDQELHLDKHNLMYIELTLGNENYRALWDTGAELSVVNRDLVNRKIEHFNFVMDIPNGVDATGNKIFFKLYKVKNFSINGVSLTGNILAMDFTPLEKKLGKGVQFIFGFNHIRQLNWFFDLSNKNWKSSIK